MGAVRRLWGRTLGKVAIIAAVAVIVLVVTAFAAARYTERSSFCVSACHEMAPYGATWAHSAHKGIPCVRCHIKPGTIELVEAKLSALREVYVHFTGQVKKPISVTEHIPDSTCRSSGCHEPGGGREPIVLAGVSTVKFSHSAHLGSGVRCIDCHSQVVHRTAPGKRFIDPTTMAFCQRCHDGSHAPADCATCHTAPHAQRGRCTDCHQLATWTTTFTHPVALGKQHKPLICEKCHTQSGPTAIGPPNGCITCHKNHHHDKKALLCADCHRPTAFIPSTFDHPKSRCQTCHTVPHPDRGACLTCHDQHSWTSHFKHPFQLAGPHVSFLCERCHTSGVNAPGKSCQSCHTPPHPVYGDCLTCHTMSSFASHFTHPITLAGVHASFPCAKCHVNGISSPGVSCTSCHGSNHGGLTNCGQCHVMAGWAPTTFRHPATGMDNWASMTCTACHPGNSFAKVYCTCHGGKAPSGD
jgi:nitrate/TMAO reductase-like tetraheme cytochrome c subunit